MKNLEKITSIIITLALLLATLPNATATASPSISHEADEALLLMLASHNMLIEGGLASRNPRMASVTHQSSPNEVDILRDIYAKQLDQLNQMGYSDDVKLRLVNELNEKLYALDVKARQLEAERQNRRKRGLFRIFARALGRATGWVMSKTMEGTGKLVQYSIEEVGPQLLQDAVFSGTPLTGAAFRAKFKEMIRNRIRSVVDHKIETRRATIASESSTQLNPAQPVAEPTSQPPQNQPVDPSTTNQESGEELPLTPEEKLNQGAHTYWMEGDSNMLGEDRHLTGEKSCKMEFIPDGVLASFGTDVSVLFISAGNNTYVNNEITLVFTSDGFEYHLDGGYQVHLYYSLID